MSNRRRASLIRVMRRRMKAGYCREGTAIALPVRSAPSVRGRGTHKPFLSWPFGLNLRADVECSIFGHASRQTVCEPGHPSERSGSRRRRRSAVTFRTSAFRVSWLKDDGMTHRKGRKPEWNKETGRGRTIKQLIVNG